MSVEVDEKRLIFSLKTPNTNYIFGILDNRLPVHIHYGKHLDVMPDIEDIFSMDRCGSVPAWVGDSGYIFDEALPQEYPVYGSPDLKTPAFHAEYSDGSRITQWDYSCFRVYKGKKKLLGLPATYANDDSEADTLEVEFADKKTGLVAVLKYTAFNHIDAIARSVYFKNTGNECIVLKSAQSFCVEFMSKDFNLSYLAGMAVREAHIHTVSLDNGSFYIDSKRGRSSHHFNPFIMLTDKNADENHGDAFGFSLVYSGNYVASACTDGANMTRVFMGINPFDFSWNLNSGEDFQTPEAILVYSASGIGEMSRTYHKLYRNNLCRGKYKNTPRPVLINNWEATYFDFNEEKILDIAKRAKSVGIEMVVLDDGWFGKRNDDTTSLGDWDVNTDKLPNGISGLADKIDAMGMKFGLWFEPEMISPISKLYEKHPEWCIGVSGRKRSMGRNQYVLDLSRKDVCDFMYDTLAHYLSTAKISYIKWDMNRSITDFGSAALESKQQSELSHRYVLGLYSVLERLTNDFPDVLIEGCCGGGGRFDPGMLYYCPQIWTSDCSDAAERMYIQHGMSLVYPFSTMGAHVSVVPNHQTNRTVPLKTRGNIAMVGQFGYELDITKLTQDEADEIKEQIAQYKSLERIFHEGDLYRLKSPYDSNYTAWEFVSQDKQTIALCLNRMYSRAFQPHCLIKLSGLDEAAYYKERKTGKIFNGSVLSQIGFNPAVYLKEKGDYVSEIFVFDKTER